MTHSLDPQQSVRLIRRRLFVLLMQAFAAVVVLTVALLLGLIAFVAGPALMGDPRFVPMQADLARTYYLAHGSWEGVGRIAAQERSGRPFGGDWDETLLLDAAGRVLIDRGPAATPLVGTLYMLQPGDLSVPVEVDGEPVGAIVISRRGLTPPGFILALASGLAVPVGIISFFTGTLTLLIGFLLARRFVTPLADVIAAAQAVAAGDLGARVQVRGPGDVRSLSDSFNRMAGALERSDRERRGMLADVAHELRTPLTVMRGKLEGIVDGVYPADETHIAPVLQETYLLERLVDDLRLLTLAETRQLRFDRQPIELDDLARRAASLFDAEAQERRIALRVEAEPALPTVQADPQRVSQVIGNLLANALRYVPEGGHITMSVRRSGGSVELAVADDGPGVAEADLPHLFDRFWRADKSRARALGGAGLGLAVARQLIEAQGGAIRAEHAPGGGLWVAFVFPAG